eukprot:TRINITY_DN20440_c0_g1_i1.p2 TRINITY_DN20440_c0_g1~~TRINITY_DN20440_c0_g1_i1.p2  ORF type:complete len:318 (+),score=85.28 TRINITY_DN20440_c0_g1_i1:77-955(+)
MAESAPSEAPSWGADIRAYCAERQAPPRPIQREPRRTAYTESRRQREFDVVLGRPRDPAAAEQMAQADHARREAHVGSSIRREFSGLKCSAGMDLITHEPRYTTCGAEEVARQYQQAIDSQPRRGRARHHVPMDSSPITPEQAPSVPPQPAPSLADSAQPRPAQRRPREYNIIAHRWASGHVERNAAEADAVRERAEQLRAGKYDPVRVRYHSDVVPAAQPTSGRRTNFESVQQPRAPPHGTGRRRAPPVSQPWPTMGCSPAGSPPASSRHAKPEPPAPWSQLQRAQPSGGP